MSGFQIVGIIVKTVIGIAFIGVISLAVHFWPAKFLFDALRFNIFKCLNSFFYLGFINEKNYFMDTLKSILKLTLSFLIYICSFIFVFFDFDLEGNWQNNLLLCVWFIASIGAFLVPYLDLRFKNISAEKIICNFAKFFDDNYNQKAPRKNTKDETVLKAVGKVCPSRLEFKDNIYEVWMDE